MDSRHLRPPGRSANIFINYRREDSAGYAGRLYDSLNSHFSGRLFMDIDTLEPGVDYVDAIDQAVGACEVLIVVIGRDWLTLKDAAGRRRLDDPEDFVRLEVERALARQIRVIPVLVGDTRMPAAEELPPSLARLARRSAIELSDARWSFDVERLAETIQEILEDTGVSAPAPSGVAAPAPPAVKTGRWGVLKLLLVFLLLPVAVLFLVLVAAIGGGAFQAFRGSHGPADGSPFAAKDSASPLGSDAAGGTDQGEPGSPIAAETAALGNAPGSVGQAGHGLPAADRVDSAPAATLAVDSQSPGVGALQSPLAAIHSPRGGDKVGPSLKVEGAVSGLGADRRAFLFVKSQGMLYPRGELVPNAEGHWTLQTKSARQDFETFVVVATSPEATALFGESDVREHGLSSLPPGAAISSSVVALKRQGRWADIFRPGGKRQPDSGH